MFLEHLGTDALRVALLLGSTLALLPLARRASASTRRLWLTFSLGGALALPVISHVIPRWQMQAPDAVVALRDRVVKEPVEEASAAVLSSPGAPLASPPAGGRTQDLAALPSIPTLLVGAWLAGALVVLTRLAVGLGRARALVRRSGEAPRWRSAAARAASATGITPIVRTSDDLDAPAVAGVFRPVVLVPRGSESWSDDRRFAVLLHEIAHVRQRDCLGHVLGQLVCALHWFDPFAWLVVRRLRLERELAADDAVILGGARASGYAEDLLVIAGELSRPAPTGALGIASRSQLATRVRAIVSPDRARRPLGCSGTTLLATSFGCGLLAVACTTPSTKGPAADTKPGEQPVAVAPAANAPAATGATLDARLQGIAEEEIDLALRDSGGIAGTVLVLDPRTGEILASAGRANGKPADVAAGSAYVTGSTFKAITLAAAFEEGVLTPDERIDCEQGKYAYGGKTMEDYKAFGVLTVPEMMAVSTNVGFTKIFDRLGGARLDRWMRKLHFGTAPAIAGAVSGVLPPAIEDKSYAGAVAAIGERMTASPLQMAAAYGTIANGGVYVAPTLSRRTGEPPREVLLKPETARALVTILEGAVDGERATGGAAKVEGTKVAGKTGTAEWDRPDGRKGTYASFVGFVPSVSPRFVILVGVEDPKDNGTGGKVAAPVFARVAAKALASTR